ncbi:MAG: carboxypeptidase-like regulatory domain-containing protein [Bryobacteraceae bacterium]
MRRLIPLWGLLAAMLSYQAAALAQKADKGDLKTRSVEGVVTDTDGSVVAGAVVHLENTKTLQVRSYITKENGSYSFYGLSPNVEYQVRAEHQGATSDTKKIDVFVTDKKVVRNLKLNKRQ